MRGIQRWFEAVFETFLFNSRLIVILAVLGSLTSSVLMFVRGALLIVHAATKFVHELRAGGGAAEDEELSIKLISSVDSFLFATVLLIFAMGIYELFISKIDPASRHADSRPNWLQIHSLDDLKGAVGKVILMILIVRLFESAVKMHYDKPVDLLYLGLGVIFVAGALYLQHLGHGHGKKADVHHDSSYPSKPDLSAPVATRQPDPHAQAAPVVAHHATHPMLAPMARHSMPPPVGHGPMQAHGSMAPPAMNHGSMSPPGYGSMSPPGYGSMSPPGYGSMSPPGNGSMSPPPLPQGFGSAPPPAYPPEPRQGPSPHVHSAPTALSAPLAPGVGQERHSFASPSVLDGVLSLAPSAVLSAIPAPLEVSPPSSPTLVPQTPSPVTTNSPPPSIEPAPNTPTVLDQSALGPMPPPPRPSGAPRPPVPLPGRR